MIAKLSKILLVDDEPITNLINKKMVSRYDETCQVTAYTEPDQAIKALPALSPDLIFLDLNMPLMDGWQFLDRMQQEGLSTPVVILTSSVSTVDKERSKTYPNVIRFEPKPLTREALQSIAEQ